MLLASVCFAQNNARRLPADKKARTTKQFTKLNAKPILRRAQDKTAGDTISVFPWTEGFETSSLTGYTFIDADNDGFNWTIYTSSVDNFTTHTGDGVMSSASYDNDLEAALTPDNWMILPSFAIPSSETEFQISWYEKGQDASYADEYYSVYVSTTGRDTASFVATTPVYSGISTGEWIKRTVNLTNYIGQTIHIAFRHYNCTDMFFLDIDDIRVGGPEPPEIALFGPAGARTGDTVMFTATSSMPSVTWNINADYVSTSNLSAQAVWETAGTYQVIATAVNSVGTISDTLDITIVECQPISAFPYNEGFETASPCWLTVSMDPANDADFGIFESEDAYEGNYVFQFSSFASADDYNQYLISPELVIPSDGSYMVSFYYNASSTSEAFRVLASSTTDDINAFTAVLGNIETTIDDEWTEVSFPIPTGTKYLAINYYGDWAYYLSIDALYIGALSAPNVTIAGPEEVGTGNAATFVATSTLAESFNWTVDNESVSETGSVLNYTFTTTGEHTISVTATNAIGTSAPATMTIDVFNCDGIELPYYPDFTEGLHCWTNRSDLEEGYGWIPSVEAFEENPEGQVLSMSAMAVWGMLFNIDVDNWLISPVISMPAEGSYEVAWKVKPYMTEYSGDHYAVYVISGNDTILLREESTTGMDFWYQRGQAIPSSVTGDFRIAFRHFNSADGYVIILDDISIVPAGTTGVEEVELNTINIYPNPANNMINVEGQDIQMVQILDINGRIAMTTSQSRIDISNLNAGVYMVRVITADGITVRKVVKK